MFSAKRFETKQFLASYKGLENKVKTYNEPVEIQLPFKVTTSFADITAFGSDYVNYMKAVVPKGSYTLKELDKVYVSVTPPAVYDKLASTADYFVYSIQHGYLEDVILLHRKSGS